MSELFPLSIVAGIVVLTVAAMVSWTVYALQHARLSAQAAMRMTSGEVAQVLGACDSAAKRMESVRLDLEKRLLEAENKIVAINNRQQR